MTRRQVVVLSTVIGLVLGVAATLVVGNQLAIRSCPNGQAPATNPKITSKCFDEGADLPKGYTWDPGGNR